MSNALNTEYSRKGNNSEFRATRQSQNSNSRIKNQHQQSSCYSVRQKPYHLNGGGGHQNHSNQLTKSMQSLAEIQAYKNQNRHMEADRETSLPNVVLNKQRSKKDIKRRIGVMNQSTKDRVMHDTYSNRKSQYVPNQTFIVNSSASNALLELNKNLNHNSSLHESQLNMSSRKNITKNMSIHKAQKRGMPFKHNLIGSSYQESAGNSLQG